VLATSGPYSQWSNGPSSDPNFFPIGVWLQSPSHIQEFKDIGVNSFVGFWGDLDQSSLSQFASAQMPLLVTQNSVGLTSPDRTWIKGWNQIDEPDNAQPDGSGGFGPCILPDAVINSYNAIRANDANRPAFLNFGQGVSNLSWPGHGSTCHNLYPDFSAYYRQAILGGDIIAFDIYPISDPDLVPNGQLERVASGVDNLKAWSNNSKIIWNFIEAAQIHGGPVPTAAQVKAEVWMSLIHGSKGIVYFVHQFAPAFREDGIFNYPTLVQGVAAINAQIISLAPVLNSPTVANGAQVSSSPANVPIDTMVKQYAGVTYVSAVAMRNNSAVATFTIPGIQAGTVNVIGENRQITMTNGQFQDSFSGYEVHLYQFSTGTGSKPSPPTGLRGIVH
jgi:hypothetical protein